MKKAVGVAPADSSRQGLPRENRLQDRFSSRSAAEAGRRRRFRDRSSRPGSLRGRKGTISHRCRRQGHRPPRPSPRDLPFARSAGLAGASRAMRFLINATRGRRPSSTGRRFVVARRGAEARSPGAGRRAAGATGLRPAFLGGAVGAPGFLRRCLSGAPGRKPRGCSASPVCPADLTATFARL